MTKIIEHNASDQMTKELSCVETIEPVTPAYRRSGLEAADVLRHSPRGKKGFVTRVGLFNFGADRDQPKLVEDFEGGVPNSASIALLATGDIRPQVSLMQSNVGTSRTLKRSRASSACARSRRCR